MSVAVFLPLLLLATTPLSLEEVLARADDHHPSIAMALAERAAAMGELMVNDGAFDPVLRARALGEASYYGNAVVDVGVDVPTPLWGTTFSGGWRLGAGDFPIYDGKQKTNDWGELRLGLLLPLLRDGASDRRRAGSERATLEQGVQEQAVRLARLEIRRQAALAYWEWVAAGARLDVAEQLLRLATTRDDQLRARVAAGDVALVEQQDQARIVAQRRARLAGAVRAMEKAAFDLALFLRDADSGAPVVVGRDRLPPIAATSSGLAPLLAVSADVLVDEARRRRPELLRLRAVRDQLEVDRRLAENQLLPALSVTAAASQDIGPTSPPNSSSSSVWHPDPDTRAVPDVDVGVVFELPVPLRQARGRLAATEAAILRLEHSTRFAVDRLTLEVEDARSAGRAAEARGAAVAAEVVAAEVVEGAERVRFEAGDSTLLFVNLREGATAEARLSVVDAALDARRAEVAIRAATGQLLDDG